jgi:hypothetical protein
MRRSGLAAVIGVSSSGSRDSSRARDFRRRPTLVAALPVARVEMIDRDTVEASHR